MAVAWRNERLMRKVKQECSYICHICGSTIDIQTHHPNGHDNKYLEVLCGKCHSLRHPELSSKLFVNQKEMVPSQLWLNQEYRQSLYKYYNKTWYKFGDLIIDKKYNTYRISKQMTTNCDNCHSNEIVKHGIQERLQAGKKHRVQMYLCNNCGHQFCEK